MSTHRPVDQGLVPLADRLRYLQFLRIAMVAPILLATWIDPHASTLSLAYSWTACGAYLVLTLPTVRAWRLARTSALSIFGGSLLLDGLFLGLMTYGSGGLDSPLR
jgi:hypothetical protein